MKPACPSAHRMVRHLAGLFWWERSSSRYCGEQGAAAQWDVRLSICPSDQRVALSHGTSIGVPEAPTR